MKDDERPQARYVKPGEMLAMDPSRIRRGPHGFFWLFGDGPKPNERRENVAIVHVRGELEHHKGWGESYEGILEKMCTALSGQDVANRHQMEHEFDADYKPMAAAAPARVVLCIDSPGGVVAGLNETQAALGKMIRESGIAVDVFVNEMAASAAYALATVGRRILCPPSAILGSIGVISTMISQAKKNAIDGYDVRLLTSGARKADGHPHAPISDKALQVEGARVEKLAAAFFQMVSKARRLPVAKVQGFEAGIFLGDDAVRRGLADAVMSYDDATAPPDGPPVPGGKARAGGNETDRRVAERRRNEVLLLAALTRSAAR